MLTDPLIGAVMRADGVDPEQLGSDSSRVAKIGARSWPDQPRSFNQPRDRGAQLRHAGAVARRGRDDLREMRPARLASAAAVSAMRFSKLRGLHLVGLGEHDLIAHRRLVERLQHGLVGVLEAVAGVDQHVDAARDWRGPRR